MCQGSLTILVVRFGMIIIPTAILPTAMMNVQNLHPPPSVTIPPMLSISSCLFPLRTNLPAPIKSFSFNGATLAYRESGAPSANHVLVWIHGLPLDSRFWTAQYDRFSVSGLHRNFFVELRGYGTSSSKLPTDINLDVTQLYCDDLLTLLGRLQIKLRVSLALYPQHMLRCVSVLRILAGQGA